MAVKKHFDYTVISESAAGGLPTLQLVLALALVLVSAMALAGCGSHTIAPISSQTVPPPDKINFHIVSAGETLYSIAWRYGLDHRKMATANGIGSPYTIFAGQRLNLDLSIAPKPVVVAQRSAVNPAATKKPVVAAPKPVVAAPKPAVKPKPKLSRPQATVPTSTATNALPKNGAWRWPVKGRVVRSYDANKRFKGVHLHAPRGTSVKAAAPGVVVYAGNGLHSYGRAIIIKHSDVYLSFYALNRRLLVKEGDKVSAGHKIAEVGGDVNNPNRIYFEVRHNGNSTDPIRLLPKQ